jgi:hypothetical protein
VSHNRVRYHLSVALAGALLLSSGVRARAEAPASFNSPDAAQGSLADIKDLRRAFLLVIRSSVVDAQDPGRLIINETYRADPRSNRRHRYAFYTIARKLNNYVKEYRSMSAVERLADADYIIVFNLLEYRVSLGTPYPYGELFVILNQRPESKQPPRIIWRARKATWAEDAVKELINSLKAVRGER